MTLSPLRGDALIGAILRLSLHSKTHRRYNLTTFTDRILRAVGANRYRMVLNEKTMEIKALAVWEESTPPSLRNGHAISDKQRKTVRPFITEFISRDDKSAETLANDLRKYLFKEERIRGIEAFLSAAGEMKALSEEYAPAGEEAVH